MRLLCTLMVVALTFVSVAAQADVTYNLYVYNTSDTSASVFPGQYVDLWVRMETGDSVSGVRYDVLLPTEGWELTSRDYGTYGWYEEDGLFDNSQPLPSGCPTTVTNSTYDVTPSDPDFNLNTAYDPWPDTVTGTVTIEDFRLTIPGSTPVGDYTISLRNPHAYESDGTPIDAYVGDDFTLGVIPEPTTIALFGLGLLGLGARLRRRRRR